MRYKGPVLGNTSVITERVEEPESEPPVRSSELVRRAVTWRRADVSEVVKDAESAARRTNRPHYVGAIGWPDGSQIYGEATLGYTDDRKMLDGLGKLFVTCDPHETTWHV